MRESGNLSFSRVFLGGHSVGGYQPETVANIFYRAMFGHDVATGEIELSQNSSYSTEGAMNIRNVKKDTPELIENVCYVYAPIEKCTDEQLAALGNGTAETENWIVTSPKGSKEGGSEGSSGGEGGNGGDGGSDGEEGDDGNGETVEDSSSRTVASIGGALIAVIAALV